MEESKAYVRWEEVVVSNDKGRRIVHYYLKDAFGGSDLAVIGKERSVRHMTYAVPNQFLRSLITPPHLSSSSSSSSFSLKWRSRREVVDWLSSLMSDSVSYGSSPMVDRFSEDEDAEPANVSSSKGISSGKMRHHSKEFSWLGSAWTCRKRRKHYQSFCRKGITISVYDFVHVMAEDNKRLVAYVEDLYEDLRANNMVSVRWFHKVDEVGIVLPSDVNDREIFFSLCLQDLNVECLDGLAAILSTQHFEKFQNEARCGPWEPYLCRRQIDNDDVKPFDITLVQGYWNQELLRSLYTPSLKLRLKITCGGRRLDGDGDGNVCFPQSGSKRKYLLSSGVEDGAGTDKITNKFRNLGDGSKAEKRVPNNTFPAPLLRKELFKQKILQQLSPGCQIEILSQDSGVRGCWFRCVILKRHQDKVKVRYQDVRDADETGYVEEWIMASRVAAPDKLGIRLCGRTIIRPHVPPREGVSGGFAIGDIVDAWLHDGWWEGIVIRKESESKIHVYLPGEQQVSIVGRGDLRRSQDWVCNRWNCLKERPDIASSLLSDIDCKIGGKSSDGCIHLQALASCGHPETDPERVSSPPVDKVTCKQKTPIRKLLNDREKENEVPNLAKDCHLKWSSSKKRKRVRWAKDQSDSSSSSREEAEESSGCRGFVLPKSLTVDHENCKTGGESLFSSSMTLSNLILTR